jgi:CheY-like chemotaxis protein
MPGRPHILLVEDHPNTRAMVKQSLEEDYGVVSASHAEEALGLLGSEAFGGGVPDLFLLAIRLGEGRDGLELLRIIRDLEPTRGVPAVAATTYATAAARKILLEAGFEAHLAKPFGRAELAEAVNEVLSTRRRA